MLPSAAPIPSSTMHHDSAMLPDTSCIPYLLVWAWSGAHPEVSATRLMLTLREAADLRQRFAHFLQNHDLTAFQLSTDPETFLTHREFLENTPVLATNSSPTDDDAPIHPDQFPAC